MFCGCNYKLNITFAAQINYCNEGTLDNTPAHSLECFHDIRMVWPPQTSGNEDFHKLAAYSRNPLFMGSGIS